ncbi:cation:proton antiporter [Oxalobacteraceae bacterium]|nr:cation:proton antiporter [Oxalobacteraceae bacterium]
MNSTTVFFAQALLVIGVPYFLWRVLRMRSILPLVVVQIITGILLGPSVLGEWAPELWRRLFAAPQLGALSGLQWLAITLFSFLTGAHLRHQDDAGTRRVVLWATVGGMALPFILGTGGGLWLARHAASVTGPNSNQWWFALAVGLCMAVTALPVLAAILREMRLSDTALGGLALSCAAAIDGATWVLLAIMLIVHGGGDSLWAMGSLLACSGAYLLVCLYVLRPLLQRWIGKKNDDPEFHLVLALMLALASAMVSELVGLHHVLGGFIAGMIWPRQHAPRVAQQLEGVTSVVLLPFFFLATGIRLSVGAINADVLTVIAVCAPIAIAAKILGSALPARMAGLDWRNAWALGTLMQTKGLVEVVVLAVLLDAGIIGVPAFSGLLFVALGTTVLAKPLTALILHPSAALRFGWRLRADS